MRKISSVKSVQPWSEYSPSFPLHLSLHILRVIRVHRKPEESEHQQLLSAPALPPQQPAHGRWAAPFINPPAVPVSSTRCFIPFQHTVVHECYPVSIKTITSWVPQSKPCSEESKTFHCVIETWFKIFKKPLKNFFHSFCFESSEIWNDSILLMDARSLKYAVSLWFIF